MQKLKMHSPDMTQEHIARIRELFPNCVTEARDKDGSLRLSVDFDLLRQELSGSIVEGPQERYHLDWPGKREAMLAANAPIAKALRPCREESVDFDTTKNLFIEGDNLDALKLLQETYLGKVKMIYIDPPYNTGNDFIYNDDFAETSEAYLSRSNQKDEAGNRLVANPDSNGRFHSDWLSMMYPRLKIARNLLADDGIIFISCDENEVINIRKICDIIFGEMNFVAQIIWKKRSTPPNDKTIAAQHEYIICISKNILHCSLNLRERTESQLLNYKNPDNHPKGPWMAGDLMANVKGGRFVSSLYFPIVNPRTGQEHYPSSNGNWRFNQEKIAQLIENNEIYFGEDDCGRPKLKRFLCDVKPGITWTTLWDFAPFNTKGSAEIAELFGNLTTFENPKPTGLINNLLKLGSDNNSIILDFFAGSSTTAHAVMQLNAEDGGNRQFIMVQLPEVCDATSEAAKIGCSTIAEISKERIRRAGKKILEGNYHESWNKDVGFRVLKVDSSNMADIFYTPDILQQSLLDLVTDNIKLGRTPEDLLFQVLLDWGVELTLPIRKESIQGKTVFFVDDNALVACFDRGIDEALVRELAACAPLRVVFRDNGFVSDAVKINVEQIFRQLSPGTEVRCL
ncbi:site-specific DNA-methyltransferase [Desulfovibrio piger]|uniref:site-specific DNA-methyltransferase n=1 Tax=Desulfovibrio piger TaxID=901 RepID=UPI003076FCAF